MKKTLTYLLSVAVVSLSLCACDNGKKETENFESGVPVVSAGVQDFIVAEPSKSYIILDNDTYRFNWDVGDEIGIFPDASGTDQASFVINSVKDASADAHLNSRGWGLVRGKSYYSYYPYTESAVHDNVTVSYVGQVQAKNAKTTHLGPYDFLYSSLTAPAEGDAQLSFSHLNCINHFRMTIPSEVRSTSKFKSFSMATSGNSFVSAATYDPTTASPSLTPSTLSNEFNVGIGYGQGTFCDNQGYLDIYAMMCPSTPWNGQTVTITLVDIDNNVFTGTFTPSGSQQAGYVYTYSATMAAAGRIIGNLSSYETANCYIVSSAGDYKFLSTQGNSNTVVTPDHVAVLWETYNTAAAPAALGSLVSSLSYNSTDNYIYFSAPSPFKEGNAVIAAYDSSNNIIWSWHIWCTDLPADQKYKNNAGYLQDRNLGALAAANTAAERNLTPGLLYQFGRKDPFVGYIGTNSNTVMSAVGTQKSIVGTSLTVDIAYSIKNPTQFITSSNASPQYLDWLYNNPRGANDTRWYNSEGKKTKYDPCPPGYRVPNGGTSLRDQSGFFGTALGFYFKCGGDNVGTTITTPAGTITVTAGEGATVPIDNGQTAFFPSPGFYYDSSGGVTDSNYIGRTVNVWGNYAAGTEYSVWNEMYSGNFDINFALSGGVSKPKASIDYQSGRACGKSVRCMKTTPATEVESVDSQSNENFTTTSSGW